MGKLNIAHHKSYHPYRRDNTERVRRDEEEARLKEAAEEGRMMLAVRATSCALSLACLRPARAHFALGTRNVGLRGEDGLVAETGWA